MPASLAARSMVHDDSMSRMTTPSVISRQSRPGSTPVSSTVRSTRSMKSADASWRGDTLTVVISSRAGEGLLPQHALATGGLDGPVADRDDEAGLVEQGQELGRADQPPLGIGPPQQGLDPDQLVVVQGHDRQVQQPELLALEGFAQAPLGRRGHHRGLHGQVEHHRCAGAVGVGVLQRHGGIPDQLLGPGGPTVEHGDAGAGGHPQVVGADAEGDAERGLELVGPPGGRRRVGHVGAEHGELGTAGAEEPFAGAQRPAQLLGRGHQQPVAHLVAIGVVDGRVAVELDQDQRAVAVAGLAVAAARHRAGRRARR